MTVWRAGTGAFYTGCVAGVVGAVAIAGTAGPRHVIVLVGPILQVGSMVALGFGVRAACHRALDRRTRIAWGLVSAAFAVLAVAGALFAAYPDLTVFPAPGDLVRIAFAPLLLAGLVAFPVHRTGARDRHVIMLDVGTVAAAAFMLLWYATIGPAVSGHRLSTVAGAVALAYPAGDLALLAGAALVLLRGPAASLRRSLSLLAAAMVVETVGDTFLGGQFEHAAAGTRAGWQLVCWTVGHTLFACAAFEQCRVASAHRPARAARGNRAVSVLPYGAIGIGYALLLVEAVAQRNPYPWLGLVLGAGAITACVLARQVLSMLENRTMAVTDGLTGVANRLHLRATLGSALARGRRTGHSVGMLLVDMDGFKQVNDGLGHEAGDQLLIAVAELLCQQVSTEDMVGRLGGDEFAVLLRDVGSGYRAEAVAERIVTALARPLSIAGTQLRARASVGVAVSGPGELSPAELVHRADLAMYAAKRDGAGHWQRYTGALRDRERDAEALAGDLRQAVPAGQLRVHYQPIVGLPHGQLAGVEALVRWQHPERGLLPPLEFIPLAERAGLIGAVGDWVLAEACRQVLVWQERRKALFPLHLHVNVSATQLVPGYPEQVLAILRRIGFPPGQLVLELTESVAVNAPAVAHLDALHRAGVRIALDDFGTGYSALSHLIQLPVDILKIDRSFVAQLDGGPEGSAVAEAILRLAQALRLRSVAEGVENLAQATELAMLGSATAQGYYFAEPLTAPALDELIGDSVDGWPVLPPAGPDAPVPAQPADDRSMSSR
ncbi:MAG TPA: EAL domain-containing protein [Rugosimonospora sp.]|nr:EAL domain-containing protein [Rugosimonospora sp.]